MSKENRFYGFSKDDLDRLTHADLQRMSPKQRENYEKSVKSHNRRSALPLLFFGGLGAAGMGYKALRDAGVTGPSNIVSKLGEVGEAVGTGLGDAVSGDAAASGPAVNNTTSGTEGSSISIEMPRNASFEVAELNNLPYFNDQTGVVSSTQQYKNGERYHWPMTNPPQGIMWHQIAAKPANLAAYDGLTFYKGRGWNIPAYHIIIGGTESFQPGYANAYHIHPFHLGAYHVRNGKDGIVDPEFNTHISMSYVDTQYAGCPPTQSQVNSMLQCSVVLARRFGIPAGKIVGHGEEYPGHRRDPVGVDMNQVRAEVHKNL